MKGNYTRSEDLITVVAADQRVRERIDFDAVVVNVYSTRNDGNASEERDSKNALFMYFQLLIDILLQMTNDRNLPAKQELIDRFKRIYEGNEAEEKLIEKFENEYRSEEAIKWYSSDFSLRYTEQSIPRI